MKKATNSKNRGKISKLFPIMQEHFGKSMNLARIKLMTLLLEALVKAQTVNLVRLANAMPTAVDKESNMRRLQRFLACYVLDLDLIARMIFSLLPVKQGLVLTMDRTNWKYGQTDINVLLNWSLRRSLEQRCRRPQCDERCVAAPPRPLFRGVARGWRGRWCRASPRVA